MLISSDLFDKVNFKAYNKTNKIFFIISFYIWKCQKTIIKNTKKDSKKKHEIFLKKKKTKGEKRPVIDIQILLTAKAKEKKLQYHCECNEIFSEEQKKKLVQ